MQLVQRRVLALERQWQTGWRIGRVLELRRLLRLLRISRVLVQGRYSYKLSLLPLQPAQLNFYLWNLLDFDLCFR